MNKEQVIAEICKILRYCEHACTVEVAMAENHHIYQCEDCGKKILTFPRRTGQYEWELCHLEPNWFGYLRLRPIEQLLKIYRDLGGELPEKPHQQPEGRQVTFMELFNNATKG